MQVEADNKFISDPQFTEKIYQALDLLKTQAPWAYGNLIGTVGRIRAAQRSGTNINVVPLTIDIASPTFNASLTWLASVLAHESVHAVQFLNKQTYTGLESEKEGNAYQLMVLRHVGAPQSEIEYMLTQKGDHFDLNKDGKYDWDDFNRRTY